MTHLTHSILSFVDPSRLGEAGLVTFFTVFVGMTVWAMTRRRQEIDRWSALPLEGEPAPVKEERP